VCGLPDPSNVDTGQNPKPHVVLIEIQPNADIMNLSLDGRGHLNIPWGDFLYISISSVL
jgi:hypothetical protein